MKIKSGGIKTVLKAIVVVMFGCAFMWRCARISSPQGGPKDSLAPMVIGASPRNNATGFKEKKITLNFNEFIQLKDQQTEFFVSPMLSSKPVPTVRGKSIVMVINDTVKLAQNTTYSFNFGNSIRDNNEGNPLNGFRYVISTGESIDSMLMSGYTVDAYKCDSVGRTLIYFYEADSVELSGPDSTLLTRLPSAIARAENNGVFIAQNLKPVDYRIYAFKDENSNFMYDPGTDMAGFLDSTYNPLTMPDFNVWLDTVRHYYTAQPQLMFRMFTEQQARRQRLSESLRPSQHLVVLQFSAPEPVIESVKFDGIADSLVIREFVTEGHDTINYWLNVASDSLPEVINGEVVYFKSDSTGRPVKDTARLELSWKYIESKAEQKARESEEKKRQKAEKDGTEYKAPATPNPFRVDIGGNEINPERGVTFTFGMPVTQVDYGKIDLVRVSEGNIYRVRHTFVQDTVKLMNWRLDAPWSEGETYRLTVTDGAFVNVAGERNDTLRKQFTVMDSEKFGTLKVNVRGKSDTSRYILQLTDEKGTRVIESKRGVTDGVTYFRFIDAGNVRLRVIEDINGNGKWDSGSLTEHRQPERVKEFTASDGDGIIAIRANWEIEVDTDMNILFAPETVEGIREEIARKEDVRVRKLEAQRRKSSADNVQNNSVGIGAGFNSIRGGLGEGH